MADDEDGPPEAVPLAAIAEAPLQPRRQPVPVTVITGFLGSGKSTLVKHVLQSDHGLRIAVILNEYGEAVENAYFSDDLEGLRSQTGEWIQLDNGCMCCSVKNDFVKALEALLAKEQQPDYILIETTGMANPGPVAAALWTDEEIEAGVQLDSILTVVDGLNINRQLQEPRDHGACNEAQVQIAYADLVLLNKMDLCSEEARTRAEADIRGINSSVNIMRTTKCSVDVALLLNRHGYRHGAEVQMPPIAEDEDEDEGADADEENEEGEDDADEGDGDDDSRAAGRPAGNASIVGHVPDNLGLLQVVGQALSLRKGATHSVGSEMLGGAVAGDRSGVVSVGSEADLATGGTSSDGEESFTGARKSSSRVRRLSTGRTSIGGMSTHSRAVSMKLEDVLDDEECEDAHHQHDPVVQTICLRASAPLSMDKVKAFVDKVLWDKEEHPEDIYRMKGVLHVQGSESKHMLQAVYELYNISASVPWEAGEARESRVVIIGRSLNKQLLATWFAETQA